MSGARKFLKLEDGFDMHRGGTLPLVDIAYETWGELNEAGDNAVLIFTGLSPSAHVTSCQEDPAPGWWEDIVGPSRPLDTRKYFVICANSMGSCFGSTGPASIDVATGEPYRLAFPTLTLEDVATASKLLVEHLGVAQLEAVVGPSMGGMTALSFSVMFPEMSRSLLVISSAPRTLPFSIALRSMQREMIRRDPEWNEGNYPVDKGPITGMRLARKIGMVSYRSAEEWEQRFGRERVAEERKTGDGFALDFEIESYLEAHAQKFTGQFDPNCYLYLSRASDLFDLAEHGGSLEQAYKRIGPQRITVVGVVSDLLFPVHQQQQLAEGIRAANPDKNVSYLEMNSIHGHDSFLVDMDQLRPIIQDFFCRD
ncbi:MAG: homoserine O-acetyltransferase [Gammaproteobacteria bacterium]|nr:homoserine O-acetyltransferase [Gammaproteobacteria bacterium]